MKTSSDWLRALGGRWFLEPASMVLVIPYLVLVSVLSGVIQIVGSGGPLEDPVPTVFLLVVTNLLSLAACWLLIGLLNRTLLRGKSEKPVSVLAVLLISYAVGAFKGFTTGLFGYGLGAFGDIEIAFGSRWLETGILGLIMIPALTLTIMKIASLNEERDLIVAERVAALLRDQDAPDEVLSRRIDSLRSELSLVIADLEEKANTEPERAQQLLESAITRLIDEHVRPLSHQIWKEQQRKVPRITPGNLLIAGIRTFKPNAWLLGALLFVPLLMGQMVNLDEYPALIRTILTTLGIVGFTLLSGALSRAVPKSQASAYPIGILIGTFAGIFLADLVLGPLANVDFLLSGTLIYLLAMQCAVYISFGAMVFAKEKELDSELLELLGSDRIEAEARRYLAGHSNRNFAQYLHSDVQNSLLATALAVRHSDNSSADFALKLDRIKTVISKLGEGRGALAASTLQAITDELHFQWDGFVELNILGHPELNLQSDSSANALLEALNEAISNSLRHGLATKISISVIQVESNLRRFVVEVVDDGIGPKKGARGLGSSLLDIISNKTWDLKHLPMGGSVLRFEFEIVG